MVQGTGKRAKTTDRHIITLSPELDGQVDEALEIARLRTVLKPMEATLGNPVAFPIVAGLVGLAGGFIILKLLFPDPVGQARSEVENAAEAISEVINTPLPDIPGVADLEEARQKLVAGTRDLLMRLWDGIVKLPPIL